MSMIKTKKRGQVTIFVIIFIMIIVMGMIIYFLYPKIKIYYSEESVNPNLYMQGCLEDDLQENIARITSQGGSLNPEHYILYNDYKIEYLCYTEEYYKTCVMQRPLLYSHMEREIKNSITRKTQECLDLMKNDYEKRGYSVTLGRNDIEVEILPRKIMVVINGTIKIEKQDVKTYDRISVPVNNNLYELIGIASSILNWEARYGDAETTVYMDFYRDVKVEKKTQSDGSKVYILSERETKNKFQFASRSIAWPPGIVV